MVILSVIMSLFVAIQDPIFQKFIVRIAGGYLSSKTGTEIRIGSLNISPDFTIHINQLSLKDQENNDLIKAETIIARPYMEDLIRGHILFDQVALRKAEVHLVKYEGEEKMNLQFLIDAFGKKVKEKEKESPPIQINKIVVEDLDFQYWNQDKDLPERKEMGLMDYSNIDVKGIQLDMEQVSIVGDSISAIIHHLAATESSGFELQHLASAVNVTSHGILLDELKLQTANSDLDLDLHLRYQGYQAFSSFVDSVSFDATIRPTDLLLSDLGPFSEALYSMPDRIQFEGFLQGPTRNIEVSDLKIDFGKETHFEGNLAMQPLDFFDGHHQITIERMYYSISDLAQFRIPGKTGTLPIPEVLSSLGRGTIRGYFEGSYRDFKTHLLATSDIGAVSVNLKKNANGAGQNVFESHIEAEQLNIGTLTKSPNLLSDIDISADINGRQSKADGLDLDLKGDVLNLTLLGNSLNEISLNGNLHKDVFNGKIDIDDEELQLGFKGLIDFSNPKAIGGNFRADIVKADLNKLNIVKGDPNTLLSASITADGINLNNFNKAEGSLTIKDLSFKNSKGSLDMEALNATIVNDNLMQKKIQLNSDFVDLEMAGQMDFSTMMIAFMQYVNNYAEIPHWADELSAFEKSKKSSDQDFVINLNFKNPKPLIQLIAPDLYIAKNTTLTGTFTSKTPSLNCTLRSKAIRFNNIKINNVECKSFNSPNRIVTRLNLDQIILRDSTEYDSTMIAIENFSITNSIYRDTIKTDLVWDDKGAVEHNKAFVSTYYFPDLEGGAIVVNQADILVNDTMWHLKRDGLIDFEDGKIRLKDIELSANQQRLAIDGRVPFTSEDTLSVSFNKFDLSTFDFLYKGKFDLDGFVFGNATVSDIRENLSLVANLDVMQLGINGNVYGDASLFSHWDNEKEAIMLDAELISNRRKELALSGGYSPKKTDDNLDFSLRLDSLPLSAVSPFLKGTAEQIQGYCKGDFTVQGGLNQPSIQGSLRIFDGGCKINFLNTFYTFSPTIELTDKLITLSDFSLTDTLGNSALVFGGITHDHLKDMALHFKLFPYNFLAMATNAGISSSFYGNAVASGMVEVSGPLNDLNLQVDALTGKGTVMTIPLGGKNKVGNHEFITFVNKNDTELDKEEKEKPAQKKEAKKFNLGLNLDVNDNALIKIALPNNLGNLEAKGSGNIKLSMISNALSLIGDYVIKDGSLMLNIQDVIRRNFVLEPGSRISWTGDPVNGTIDAIGVYQTKAAISSLGLGDSINTAGNNIKVECLVRLKNKLMNPDISFGLRLPNASEDLQQAVFSVIDTTNQAEVLLQSIYLMVMNSFNYGGTTSNYYGIVTNQINDFIAQFTDDLNINVNYKPGDTYSNEEMTVALKKQFFDDRITVETNFGVSNNFNTNSTNIIGDVNVDIKITKDGNLSAQVFNRSNYNNFYYQYSYYKMAPYTQGIGLSYGRSFDRFKDLFKKRKTIVPSDRPLSNERNPKKNPTEKTAP